MRRGDFLGKNLWQNIYSFIEKFAMLPEATIHIVTYRFLPLLECLYAYESGAWVVLTHLVYIVFRAD